MSYKRKPMKGHGPSGGEISLKPWENIQKGEEGAHIHTIFDVILSGREVYPDERRWMPFFPYDGDTREQYICDRYFSQCATTLPLVWISWRSGPSH